MARRGHTHRPARPCRELHCHDDNVNTRTCSSCLTDTVEMHSDLMGAQAYHSNHCGPSFGRRHSHFSFVCLFASRAFWHPSTIWPFPAACHHPIGNKRGKPVACLTHATTAWPTLPVWSSTKERNRRTKIQTETSARLCNSFSPPLMERLAGTARKRQQPYR